MLRRTGLVFFLVRVDCCTYFFASLAIVTFSFEKRKQPGCTYFFVSTLDATRTVCTIPVLYLLLCFFIHCYSDVEVEWWELANCTYFFVSRLIVARSTCCSSALGRTPVPTSLFLDSLLRSVVLAASSCTYFFASLLIVTQRATDTNRPAGLYLLLCFSTHCCSEAQAQMVGLGETVPTSLFLYSLLQQRLKGKHFR